MSGEFKHNLHKNGIKLRNVKSYSPWANGEVERLNRSLNRANQAVYAKNKNYGEELNKFPLLYRTTLPHLMTGKSPELLQETQIFTSWAK